MSKALQGAKSFDINGVNADLIDNLDSTDFEGNLGNPTLDDQVLSSKIDGTREWITVTTIVNWGDIEGTLSQQTDLWSELQNRYTKTETFSKSEHISISNGSTDGGKPILLNSQGKVDSSMIEIESLQYIGNHDPSAGEEYPDTTGISPGGFWYINNLISPDNPTDPEEDQYYQFTGGDLVGQQIKVGNFMLYGSEDTWSILTGIMNPLDYMKIDKTTAFENNGNPLIVNGVIENVDPGTNDNDSPNMAQLNQKSDITYVDSGLNEKVSKSGDSMTDNLEINKGNLIKTVITDSGVEVHSQDDSNEIEIIANDILETVDFKFNTDTSLTVHKQTAPSTKYNPTEINHLTRKDYVDTKEPVLGNPSDDGQILSSDTSGNRSWVDLPNSAVWGSISGTLSNQTDLWNELETKALLDGTEPFTGDVTFNYDINVGSNGTASSVIYFWSQVDSAYSKYLMLHQTSNKLETNAELYSSEFISSGGTIRTGYNSNNNSVYEFTDPSGPEIPTVFWDNANKDFFVDTNNLLNQRLFHNGNLNLMPVPDQVQYEIDTKEDYLNTPTTDGMVLSSLQDGTRSWITPPQGVTEHNLLSGRDEPDTHPIESITDLRTELDSKSDISHTHSEYVDKTGDTMTGNLILSSNSPVFVLRDTDDGKESRFAQYPSELQLQTDKSNFIFSGVLGGSFPGEVYIKKTDGTHSFYHSGNDGVGSGLDADLLQNMQPNELPISDDTQLALDAKADLNHNHEISDINNLQDELDLKADDSDLNSHVSNVNNPHQVNKSQVGLENVDNTSDLDKPISNDTQDALDLKANITEIFLQSQFIDESTGATDGGKPIVLNTQGKIDISMLDSSTFYYVDPWDPSDPDGPNDDNSGCDPVEGCEYPDTTGHSHGAFWFTSVLSNPDNPSDPEEDRYYTFTTGDLAGKQIQFGDFMVWGSTGWSIMASQMNPLLYMRIDKTQAFLDNGNPLIVNGRIENVQAANNDTDAVNYSQFQDGIDNHTHEISDINNLQNELDNKSDINHNHDSEYVNISGDSMTGQLNVNDNIHADNIYSRNEITARSIISTGINSNGNSAIQFNYMNGLEGVIYFDNTEKDFYIDRTSSIDPNEENLKIWHQGNMGSGSGLDADTLDGLDSTDFAPVNHNHDSEYVNISGDVMTGDLEIDSLLRVHGGTATGGYLSIHDYDNESNGRLKTYYRIGEYHIQGLDSSDSQIPTEMYINGNLIYNSGNSDFEDNLGLPTNDGEILTSLTDGTRQWKPIDVVVPMPTMGRYDFVGDGVTTTYPVDSFTPYNCNVYYNGVRLQENIDYNSSSGTEIVFTSAPEQDDLIHIETYNLVISNTYPNP